MVPWWCGGTGVVARQIGGVEMVPEEDGEEEAEVFTGDGGAM